MKKEWKNPLLYLFSKGWQYSDNKKRVVCFWVLFILAEIIETFFYPLVLARIMDIAQKEGVTADTVNRLFTLLGLLIVSVIIAWILHGPARVLEMLNAFKIKANYRKYLLKGVVTLPLEWHVDHHCGDTIDKIEKGTKALHDFSSSSFTIIYAFVRLLGSYAMLVYFSHSAAYIVLGMVLLSMFITMQFDRILVKQYDILNRSENEISESVFDRISNITTVIILRVEKLVLDVISKKIDEPYELQLRNNKINELKWFLVQVSCTLMTATVLGTYFWQTSKSGQTILMGSLFLLMNYLDRISNLFFQFAHEYGEILKHRSRVANSELLTKDFRDESLSNHVLPTNWQNLSIKNLNFTYSGGKEGYIHINNANLEIHHGQKVAFVGKRGSGKTTLLRIMRDLYKPKSLTLEADGVEIPNGTDGISRAVALIPQTPEIFATTIRENITFGAEVSDEMIQKITDIACFSEVIKDLPKGLESTTKEKGVNLSDGQRQCLALARGLLASEGRDIILLDEPTSSLDKATERKVYGNIFKHFPDKTIISTVHGLHLLPLFDIIYVFDKGEIVGRGTVEKLLSSCPRFQKLWQAMENVAEELEEK
ncbi:MAG: ABC transporter ATP-binding protein [Candidatus Taylorbacteria bacterium]|nr:ABC transporter ATP-binding protein [Candidatus Taylorbacteria bacterium]